MLGGMKGPTRLYLAACLVAWWLPSSVGAVICKTVDADGVVSYSEVPASECPEAVKLPDYSRYAPRPIDDSGNAPAAEATADEPVAPFAGYTRMAITEPAVNGTVRNNQGDVPVTIELEPELQPGHTIALTLDGRPVEGAFASTRLQIAGVDRGTHTLRAQVNDETGLVLIASSPALFTLRRRGLLDGPPDVETPVEPSPGFPGNGDADFGSPGTPPDYTPGEPDYTPGAPDYTPGGGGIPSAPGGNNPAFAPKYTP
jgi:hypothetical protein